MQGDNAPLLDEWRQGDLALVAIELPAITVDDEGLNWQAIDAPHGVAILSQSCDIVRAVEHRPFVQIAGLVSASPDEISRAERGETPSRLYLECLKEKKLLIDLDSAATVHKAAVAGWERTIGCSSDAERRRIAAALARHRQRFAFPDSFNDLILPVRRWIESKRSKESSLGNFVRAMHEVRVSCDDWEKPSELTFLVIVSSIPEVAELKEWEAAITFLEGKAKHDSYPEAEFRIVTYDDISAREYLASDRLDWDGLSDAP